MESDFRSIFESAIDRTVERSCEQRDVARVAERLAETVDEATEFVRESEQALERVPTVEKIAAQSDARRKELETAHPIQRIVTENYVDAVGMCCCVDLSGAVYSRCRLAFEEAVPYALRVQEIIGLAGQARRILEEAESDDVRSHAEEVYRRAGAMVLAYAPLMNSLQRLALAMTTFEDRFQATLGAIQDHQTGLNVDVAALELDHGIKN